jgi:hypothetical protein
MVYEKESRPYEAKFIQPTGYSFNLNEDMIALVAKEFAPEQVAAQLAEAIKGKPEAEIPEIAKSMFSEFGQKWIRRCYQLGEEYPDRTYEVIRECADSTGEFVFPFLGQRAIEIAYLATQELYTMPVEVNHRSQLIYRVDECKYYEAITAKCGPEVAKLLTCRHACLAAAETVFEDLNQKVTAEMLAETPQDGCCRFSVNKI